MDRTSTTDAAGAGPASDRPATDRQAAADPAADVPAGFSPDEARIIRNFFAGDRLKAIPGQDRKLRIVARYLLERCFAADRDYPEREVNERLAVHHEDTALLRRTMVEAGLLTRSNGIYRRTKARTPDASQAQKLEV